MRQGTEPPVVLVVAGLDSSGGAGIAADVRAAVALGATARLAVTAVTAQTKFAVGIVHLVPPAVLREQLAAALFDGRVGAVKIGMLGGVAAVETIAEVLQGLAATLPVVVDPVLVSTSGGLLLDAPGTRHLIERLLPLATVLTPNLAELDHLAGLLGVSPMASIETRAAALLRAGARAVLVKGGHAEGPFAEDILFRPELPGFVGFSVPRINARLRGTGCTLSTAIAVHLAQGFDLEAACGKAKSHITSLLAASE